MAIVITSTEIPDSSSILFSVVSGVTNEKGVGYEWYLNGAPICNTSTFRLDSPISGYEVYVKIKDYTYSGCATYWYDGNFYGGTFVGNFAGGTFHYGLLNGIRYNKQEVKTKHFIKKI